MDPRVEQILDLSMAYAKQIFKPGYFDSMDPVKAKAIGLGRVLSQGVCWEGGMIATAAAVAFEDANYHEEAARLREWDVD